MLSAQDNDLLTLTGRGTPMGEYMRCFWQPVALSEELPHPDCDPVRVAVMGEDLLAFRDSVGRVGLVSPRCPHRGADLYFGRNEEGGLRCAFHGWKFDVTGQCLDMPNIPADAAYRERMCLPSYPVREWGDFVWAFLGPADQAQSAELPCIEFAASPASHRVVQKKLQQCNWAQAIEGGLDTAHFSFLHMPAPSVQVGGGATSQVNADHKRLNWMRNDPMPRFSVREHDCGFVAGAARTADGNDLYWRISQFMLPNHGLAPNALPGETYQGQTFVPIDDHSCWIYCYAWNPERPLTDDERTRISAGHGVFAALGPGYVPVRNRSNNYLLDRREQRHVTFTGVRGVSEQDAMIQDSQGLIADRTREHLGPTDLAIVLFRRQVMSGARALRDSGTLPAAARNGNAYRIRGGSALADGSIPFEQVMLTRFGDEAGRVDS